MESWKWSGEFSLAELSRRKRRRRKSRKSRKRRESWLEFDSIRELQNLIQPGRRRANSPAPSPHLRGPARGESQFRFSFPRRHNDDDDDENHHTDQSQQQEQQ